MNYTQTKNFSQHVILFKFQVCVHMIGLGLVPDYTLGTNSCQQIGMVFLLWQVGLISVKLHFLNIRGLITTCALRNIHWNLMGFTNSSLEVLWNVGFYQKIIKKAPWIMIQSQDCVSQISSVKFKYIISRQQCLPYEEFIHFHAGFSIVLPEKCIADL